MMIVVPGFAHRDQAAIGYVVALHARTIDMPGARPAIVREVADQPVSGDAGRHPQRDAPNDPWHAADSKEHERPRNLLRHPGALDKLIEAILAHAPLHHQLGWMREHELAMQLPEAVAQDRRAVREIWMAVRLALRPVADVVLADHAVGTGHAHQRAAIDEEPLEPE